MKIITNKENIAVTVPFSILLNPESIWKESAYLLMITGSPSCLYMMNDNLKVSSVRINYIEDNIFRLILAEVINGHDEFRVDFLKNEVGNEPYVKILKADLLEEYDNHFKYENDTHFLIPIRQYVDGVRVNGDHARTEQILSFFNAYSNLNEDKSNLLEELGILYADADGIKQMIIDEGFEPWVSSENPIEVIIEEL